MKKYYLLVDGDIIKEGDELTYSYIKVKTFNEAIIKKIPSKKAIWITISKAAIGQTFDTTYVPVRRLIKKKNIG